MTEQDDLRLLLSYLEATGYRQILNSCEGVGDSVPGSIRCTFDFHGLRSGEIGRGPFGGSSFDLFVRDGKIVRATQYWGTEKFSPQMWEPFAGWVSTAHPKDAAVMYTDESHSNVRLTEESVRLWDARTREYVEEVGPEHLVTGAVTVMGVGSQASAWEPLPVPTAVAGLKRP